MTETTRARALAVAGVAGLMIVGLASLIMIASAFDGDDEPELSAPPSATGTPRPTPTAKPKPTPVPLTAEQRAARDAAVQLVESKGFEVVRKRDYDPRRRLRVLIGEDTAGGRLAFFFVEDDYIGNDGTSPSQRLSVGRQSDTRVTLRYGVYQAGDEPCCPSETRAVRFEWDGQRLQPLDSIPDASLRVPAP